MNTTNTIPASAKKYIAIIKSGIIQEREIISMRSLMNRNKDAATAIFEAWNDNELAISHEQTDKGYSFLLDQWKSKTGKVRKNNPFGYREIAVLENFSHFTLKSLYNAGNAYVDNYLPLYCAIARDGSGFEYYYNGEINITG